MEKTCFFWNKKHGWFFFPSQIKQLARLLCGGGGCSRAAFWMVYKRKISWSEALDPLQIQLGYQGLWLRVFDGETNVVVCCFYLFSSNESLTKTLGTYGFILSHVPSDMISLFKYSIFILSLSTCSSAFKIKSLKNFIPNALLRCKSGQFQHLSSARIIKRFWEIFFPPTN